MRILAGPDDWSYFTANFALGLDRHDTKVFKKGKEGLSLAEGRPISDLLEKLPSDWEPDWVVWWLPEYQRIPPGIEDCPYPTLLVISDWNVISGPLEDIVGAFDVVATDAMGYRRLSPRSDIKLFHSLLYGYVRGVHRQLSNCERDICVGYIGSTNGHAYGERMRLLASACLGLEQGQVVVGSGAYGEDYVRLLNRFQITLNHSLRGELNMRSYEAMACGSLLFCEDSNVEVQGVFTDGEHCVLYNESNLVDRLKYYLSRPQELAEVALSGYRRVQEFSYQNQWDRLLEKANELYRSPAPRSFQALTEFEKLRRWCNYSYHVFSPHPVAESLNYTEAAQKKNPGDEILQNVLGCLQVFMADLSQFGEREVWLDKAAKTLAEIDNLGVLPKLSLAQVLIAQFRNEEARQVLEAVLQEPRFQEVCFYPRMIHPLTFLWEKELDSKSRFRSVMWRIHDLLSGLKADDRAHHCRLAIEYRDDQPATWFRLSRCEELPLSERLQALERTIHLAPFFIEAHLLRLELGPRETDFAAWAETVRKLIFSMTGPDLQAACKEYKERLHQASQAQELIEPPATTVEFAQRIRFEFCSPNVGLNTVFLWEPIKCLEVLNTVFPSHDQELKNRLSKLVDVPRMSSLAIAGIINRAVERLPQGQAYLNVGVWNGYSFLAGLLGNESKRCIGVDNFSQFGGPAKAFQSRYDKLRGPAHSFHDLDYEVYLKEIHSESLGLYFYDGEHSYTNQYRGLWAAEKFFAPGCLVLVDDTNWNDPRQATLDFVAASQNDYRLVLDVRTPFSGHPTWWNGLMILEYLGPKGPETLPG